MENFKIIETTVHKAEILYKDSNEVREVLVRSTPEYLASIVNVWLNDDNYILGKVESIKKNHLQVK